MNEHLEFRSIQTPVPADLEHVVLAVGGRNIYKRPMYRLVLAQDRVRMAAGAWTIWKPGTSLDDRSGLGIRDIQKMLLQFKTVMEAAALACSMQEQERMRRELEGQLDEFIQSKMIAGTPLAVHRGITKIPMYNFEGWIIEKWKPAHTFGSPGEWYSYRFEGEAALGPYPSEGAYELCAGPTPYQPSPMEIEEAIRHEMRAVEGRASSPRERVLQMMAETERVLDAQQRETENTIEAVYKETSPLMNRLSLGAGKVRDQMAKDAGLKGHFGN